MQTVRRRLKIFLALFLVVMTAGTVGFMVMEDLSFSEAFYYNIVTMSTVGYGDIHPTKQASRIFAILLIVVGVGTFLGVIANITEMILLRRETQSRMRKVNMLLGVFFSEALLALFHLTDELSCRDGMNNLPESDRNHLAGDMNRAYKKLVEQWLVYMSHLKNQYPYLFSLAVRKNPFDPEASPIVLQ